jgi:hypothetical protein
MTRRHERILSPTAEASLSKIAALKGTVAISFKIACTVQAAAYAHSSGPFPEDICNQIASKITPMRINRKYYENTARASGMRKVRYVG